MMRKDQSIHTDARAELNPRVTYLIEPKQIDPLICSGDNIIKQDGGKN
jgi:hypothetical protein